MTQQENTIPASDSFTVDRAFEKFFMPPKKPLSEQEQKIQEQADTFIIPAKPVDLTAYSWGKGATILLVHGWGGCAMQFFAFIEPLVRIRISYSCF